MQAEWEPDELIDAWTLTGGDWDLIANKAGVTRLGFAVMLKFYEIEGRFPAYPEEVPAAAVRYLGSLVKVAPALFARYSWSGRSIKYHRSQIRKVYGTRPPTEDDEERWAQWLAMELCRPRRTGTGWRPRAGGVAAARGGAAEHGQAGAWSPRAAGSSTPFAATTACLTRGAVNERVTRPKRACFPC